MSILVSVPLNVKLHLSFYSNSWHRTACQLWPGTLARTRVKKRISEVYPGQVRQNTNKRHMMCPAPLHRPNTRLKNSLLEAPGVDIENVHFACGYFFYLGIESSSTHWKSQIRPSTSDLRNPIPALCSVFRVEQCVYVESGSYLSFRLLFEHIYNPKKSKSIGDQNWQTTKAKQTWFNTQQSNSQTSKMAFMLLKI